MKPQSFEMISCNLDIIQYIFELLNFQEKVQLANVSQQLQYVFKKYIWRNTYKKIRIIKCHNDRKCQMNKTNKCQCQVMVTNDTELNNIMLKPDDLNLFLNIYSKDIEELIEKRGTLINVKQFSNLTSICYHNMIITDEDLQEIAQNCTKLEKLEIIDCQNRYKKYFVTIGQDLNLKTLAQMKKLTHFTLHNYNFYNLVYEDFIEIIKKLKLKYLNLHKVNIPDDNDDYKDIVKINFTNTLEELNIYGSFASSYWSTTTNIYLRNFENLKSLTIKMVKAANQQVLETLATSCKQLEMLKFIHTKFDQIQQFSILTTLKELSFHACVYVNHKLLKDILKKLKLIKFSSTETEYSGNFEDFKISRSLKSINIDNISTYEFKSLYNNNHIMDLTWYDDRDKAERDVVLNCPNLEILEIVTGFLSIEQLLSLKSLIKLTLRKTWYSDPVALLKHTSLRELHLADCEYGDIISKQSLEIVFDNINLESIIIPWNVFLKDPKFWYNVMEYNRKLKLNFSYNGRFVALQTFYITLKKLEFPRDLKYLYLAGIKVDCKNLKTNYVDTMDQILIYLQSVPADELKFRIIFEYF